MAAPDLPWNSLPLEILRLIVDNLPGSDLFNVRRLSKTFAAIAAVSDLFSPHDRFSMRRMEMFYKSLSHS